MVPRLAGFVVALTVVIAGAQAGAQTPQAPPDTQLPPVISLPPALDRVLRDYEAAWRDGDGPRLAALFTEDGFAVQSGSPIRRGRAAIAGGLTKPGGPLQLTAYAYSRRATSATSSAATAIRRRSAPAAASCWRYEAIPTAGG